MIRHSREALVRLFGVWGFVLAIALGENQITILLQSRLSEQASSWFTSYAVSYAIGIGVVWLSIEFFVLIFMITKAAKDSVKFTFDFTEGQWIYYSHFYNFENTADQISDFNQKIMPNDYKNAALSRERTLSLIQIDTRRLQRIGRVRSVFGKKFRILEGYYIVSALTARGVRTLLSGSILNGHGISDDMLTDDWGNARGIYVFGVYARDNRIASAHTMSALANFLYQRFEKHPLTHCFTRPGTHKGAQQMERFSFERIPNSEIQWVSRTEVMEKWARLEDVYTRYCVMDVDPETDEF